LGPGGSFKGALTMDGEAAPIVVTSRVSLSVSESEECSKKQGVGG